MITGVNGFGNASLFQNTGITVRDKSGTENDSSTESTHSAGWDGSNNGGSVSSAGGMLSMTDFYTLLAAQLRYQDADNPMDTSEMMAQMVQSQMIQTITQLSEVTVTTYAASMAGKEVTVAEVDAKGNYTGKNTVGVVESVVFSGSTPILFIDGKGYSMSQLMAVGKIPEAEEPDKGDGTEGTEKPGEGNGTEGTEKPGEGNETEGTEKPGEGNGTEGTEKPGEGNETEGTEKPGEGNEIEGTEEPDGNGGDEGGMTGNETVGEMLQRRMIIL